MSLTLNSFQSSQPDQTSQSSYRVIFVEPDWKMEYEVYLERLKYRNERRLKECQHEPMFWEACLPSQGAPGQSDSLIPSTQSEIENMNDGSSPQYNAEFTNNISVVSPSIESADKTSVLPGKVIKNFIQSRIVILF